MVKVLGVGALNWDRLIRVSRLAKPGEEICITAVREEPGGSAANTIAGLARLGVECGFVGRAGDDREGGMMIASLENDGVDTGGIKRVSGRSGSVYAFVDDSGERTMYVDPGVNDELSPGDLNEDLFKDAGWVHLSSFAGGKAMEAAKKVPEKMGEGSLLSFSPGFLTRRGSGYLMPLLEATDLLFLNLKESRWLTGEEPEDGAKLLLEIGVGKVAVTLGEQGCLVAENGGSPIYVEGEAVEAVDTTGAGDAFAAGFLYGEINGFDNEKCAKIGNHIASLGIQKLGARAGLPQKEALKEFL